MVHYHYGPSTASDAVPSSPPANASSPASSSILLSPIRSTRRKERRNPSVTPRRFGRFFTPRSSLPSGRSVLGMLDGASVNNRQLASPMSFLSDPLSSDPLCPPSPSERLGVSGEHKRLMEEMRMEGVKRRRIAGDSLYGPQGPVNGTIIEEDMSMTESPSGEGAKPKETLESLGDRRKATLNLFFKASRSGSRGQEKSGLTPQRLFAADPRAPLQLEGYQPKPVRKFRDRGFESHLLDREHGFSLHHGRQHLSQPACDPRIETASFYSRSNDLHHCVSSGGGGNTIPFSLASCHKASVTAIGDEQGCVRLFNTTLNDDLDDSKVDVYISVHDNAIMDLAFSQDDMRLATACGDRSGRILDVPTQTVAAELGGGHWDSLRQVAFQPGEAAGNVIASSDRAGRIQIWDLRCSSSPVNNFSCPSGIGQRDTSLEPLQAKGVNTIDNAHERTVQGNTSSASVTAIHWMPPGREHLLLSASEANASIKLWDTRYIKPRRQAEETPLAVTQEPRGHTWRSYGITSLALSSDAARLYAVCKDSTVYAYSTSHLMLGHAPELENGATKRRPNGAHGLGPMYGFKHDLFRAQSFYVKCDIRPSVNGSSELLAVGSTDGCALLFPTDERYIRSAWAKRSHLTAPEPSFATPSQSISTPSAFGSSATPLIPISRLGTPLIRGHSREVTTLSWSHDGKLVTASDDYIVRQWQQDEARARYLRQVGEFGGERHLAGWADVGDDWDTPDDDDE
ncbi:WD40 repeat-like protein [Trichoderma citrinoviride]|uniref:WD40 repeat-like protein n=1 Tax=Trichoderma citrinoviride TaxID=58853 RepID=A0A2T4BK11_9HYPO|nr:WD40 repeat-like protein [Trichoderma citrinoviride]PTB69601.1 WD40 repeat-like protein [Trichoderma citrinoviride]